MRGIPFYFFAAAVICVTCGMGLGIAMAASGDHALGGAHAHLNLVGWATMALFGVYYYLTPQAARAGLARIHLLLAIGGVVLMVPGIAMAVMQKGEGLAIAGSMITGASMLVFLVTVLRHGFGARA
ncbi:hypothetical protein [Actibacterium sp. XHP0104]|uniref:hypothetical protein n=1 Tax=Actibacterium sp. XHP0104 TaxID=2984335 RepID=UPI0021E715BD|nr:hypothetical protein [Actibacterium sp. XHP0104]MCV2881743.1 hypothetical protein [Actibacterium sp. XHP0104]